MQTTISASLLAKEQLFGGFSLQRLPPGPQLDLFCPECASASPKIARCVDSAVQFLFDSIAHFRVLFAFGVIHSTAARW